MNKQFKISKKYIVFLWFIFSLIFVTSSYAQEYLNGPTTVIAGIPYTYTMGGTCNNYTFSVSRGVITSSNSNSVIIVWNNTSSSVMTGYLYWTLVSSGCDGSNGYKEITISPSCSNPEYFYTCNNSYSNTQNIGARNTIYAGANSTCPSGVTTLNNGSNITMKAGKSIEFASGFSSVSGAILYASIAMPCMDGINFREINAFVEEDIDSTNVAACVSMFPNPTAGLIHIVFKNTGKYENADVVILDIFGKQIYSDQIVNVSGKSEQVNLNDYENGTYFIKVTLASGIVVLMDKIILSK